MQYDYDMDRKPVKWHFASYTEDALAAEKIDLLERAGFVRERTYLTSGAKAPRGSITVVKCQEVQWYAQALSFRNALYRSFLLQNPHLLSAEFVIGLREPKTESKLPLLDKAVVRVPLYLQKITWMRANL